MEAPPGFEPGMEVLQTSALPLGYGADLEGLERSAGLVSHGSGAFRAPTVRPAFIRLPASFGVTPLA
jgi:hypothetical protein